MDPFEIITDSEVSRRDTNWRFEVDIYLNAHPRILRKELTTSYLASFNVRGDPAPLQLTFENNYTVTREVLVDPSQPPPCLEVSCWTLNAEHELWMVAVSEVKYELTTLPVQLSGLSGRIQLTCCRGTRSNSSVRSAWYKSKISKLPQRLRKTSKGFKN